MQIITGGGDCKVWYWDLQQNAQQQIGYHNSAVRSVFYSQVLNLAISGGFDGFVRFWDPRQQTPVKEIQHQAKIYTMSVEKDLMVLGLSDRKIPIYNLTKFQQPQWTFESNVESALKFQTKVISCFPDATGFAVGSIEGRIHIRNVNLSSMSTARLSNSNDFIFKCHREGENVWAVNDIAFNKQYHTFATCGGDSQFAFWDKVAKQRLKGFNKLNAPVTACDFNVQTNVFAYACGYDWSKGIEYAQGIPCYIAIHPLPETEIKNKSPIVTPYGSSFNR